MRHRLVISFCAIAMLIACKSKGTRYDQTNAVISVAPVSGIPENHADASIVIEDPSKVMKLKDVIADLDGDNKDDTISIFRHDVYKKYGLKIVFGNGRTDFLAAGEYIDGTRIDNLNWVGIFEQVPKGSVHYNNVNEEGDIVGEDEVAEKDKIRLPNDGIFIHQAEACGGGIIYLDKGRYRWIQQE